jgi:hypothetical protein
MISAKGVKYSSMTKNQKEKIRDFNKFALSKSPLLLFFGLWFE